MLEGVQVCAVQEAVKGRVIFPWRADRRRFGLSPSVNLRCSVDKACARAVHPISLARQPNDWRNVWRIGLRSPHGGAAEDCGR